MASPTPDEHPVQTNGSAGNTASPEVSSASLSRRKRALRGRSLKQQAAMLAPPGAHAKSGKQTPLGGVDTSSFERWVQSGLNAVGAAYGFLPTPLDVDGKLGKRSRAAVRGFQRHAKEIIGKPLAVDGIVGARTTSGLEASTHIGAPSVQEKARHAPTDDAATIAPAVTPKIPGTDAASGASSGVTSAGGAAASPTAPKHQERGGKDAVVERPANPDAKKKLAEGKDAQGDETVGKSKSPGKAKPAKPRSGPAGKADELRRRWAKGMLVSLSIPKAYDSIEDAIKYVEGGHALDSYAYRVHYPAWASTEKGSSVVQAQWNTIRPAHSKLPAKLAGATPKQKQQIIAAVGRNGRAYDAAKKAMWANKGWRRKLATTAYGNNKYIPNSTASFAKAQGAVAGEGGVVKIGKSMIYHTRTELPAKVVETSKAAAALLKSNPPASGATPNQDAKVSKVRFLTIASHGWPTGMGGHGAAHSARFTKKQVPALVSAMSSALSGDVRVRLFACHTSRVKGGKAKQASDGTIGDAFRDALLAQGKKDGAVIGHTESGDTQTNGTTRFMKADKGTGHLDWRYYTVFDKAFRDAWLQKMGAKPTKKTRKVARAEMRAFFGREGWMEDIKDEAALTKSVRARWNAKHPDAASLSKSVRKKLGIHLPKTSKPKSSS